MKKKSKLMENIIGGTIIIFIAAVFILVVLYGGNQTIVYQGKQTTIDNVQEIIGDQLEAENPGLDIEVSISVEDDE